LKRGWMRLWHSGSVPLALTLMCVPVQAQMRDAFARSQASAPRTDQTRNNELTLAGLHPGRDSLTKALHHFSKGPAIGDGGASRTWRDDCRHETLSIIANDRESILEVRVSEAVAESKYECGKPSSERWVTGHGLAIGDSCSRVLTLYGQPGSRGPSTKGGQQLELLYYAFDWAGPDVPQVMTVLCNAEKDDKPGRVVEITLAAPSL
jgi:hypothetical protein